MDLRFGALPSRKIAWFGLQGPVGARFLMIVA